MKKIVVVLAFWPSAALAQVDDKCQALIQEAKVESALLKSPSAIVRLGTVDTSEQSVVAGVSYSFSDRHRGTLIDQRALVQCEEAKAKDELINYLRYVKVEEDQVRAASENAFLRNKLSSLEEGNAKMRALLAANFITISEFEEYSITTEMIRSRINQNDIALSRDNAFDKSLDLLAAINRVREATRRLYDISHKVRTAAAWDIGTQTGLRAPINGHNGVAPFGALSLRYSFGKGVSERSAKLATEYATKAMDEDVGGVLSSVQDAMRNYAQEAELVERNEMPLTAARANEYGRILVSIDGVDTGRAQLVRAQAIARKVYNEAILSGLKARVKFMKAQSRALQQGS
jgi:hypothetical protein